MKRVILAIGTAVALAASACGGGGGGGNAIHGHKVAGTMAMNNDAGGVNASICVDKVWCAWAADGSHLILGATFHNTSEVADLDVRYDPGFIIVGGGKHGDSVANRETTRVASGSSVTVIDDAGSPSGIKKYAPIGACVPALSSVDAPS
jgi:hypothetical protein